MSNSSTDKDDPFKGSIVKPISRTMLQFIKTDDKYYQFHPPFEIIVYSKDRKRSEAFKMAHIPDLDLWGLGITLYQAIDNIKIDIEMLILSYVLNMTDEESTHLNDKYLYLRNILKNRLILRKL